MVVASRGFRRKTRRKLKQETGAKFTPETYLRTFTPNQQVVFTLQPASHAGMPHPRFMGLVGTVIAQRGQAYEIRFLDGNKKKTLAVRPEHLQPLKKGKES